MRVITDYLKCLETVSKILIFNFDYKKNYVALQIEKEKRIQSPPPTKKLFQLMLAGKGKMSFLPGSVTRQIYQPHSKASLMHRKKQLANIKQILGFFLGLMFCFGIFVLLAFLFVLLFSFFERERKREKYLFIKQGLCVPFWLPGACSIDQVGRFHNFKISSNNFGLRLKKILTISEISLIKLLPFLLHI